MESIIEFFSISHSIPFQKIFYERVGEFQLIKQKIKIENQLRTQKGIELIATKWSYDQFALLNGLLICDESDELYDYKVNYSQLFELDKKNYIEWVKLVELCKEYSLKYSDMENVDIYKKISLKSEIIFERQNKTLEIYERL